MNEENKLNLGDVSLRKFKAEKIGRKDINGKDIREGDIIEVHGKISWGGVITYNNKGCGFCFDDNGEDEYTFSHGWGESQESTPEDNWRVVGSIYGN